MELESDVLYPSECLGVNLGDLVWLLKPLEHLLLSADVVAVIMGGLSWHPG